jgi:hypothetical protein
LADITKSTGDTSPAPRRSIRLKTVLDVKRLLARTINQTLRGEIDGQTAARVGYLCGIMLKTFEIADFDRRLSDLEEAATNMNFNRRTG